MLERLLVTGASGGVATLMRPFFASIAKSVRLSDIRAVEDLAEHEEYVHADLDNAAAVDAIVEGCDGVFHLGGMSTEADFDTVLSANIIGTHNLYSAAQRHGQPRIIFASSNHAMGAYSFEDTLDASALPRPDSYYGVSKVFGEAVGSMYFDKFGQETAVVRIGSCFAEPVDPRMLSTWFSPRDFEKLVERIFAVKSLGYQIIYGASNNKRRFWDDHMSADLGWQPQDDAESYAANFKDVSAFEKDIEQGLMTYQGGIWLKAPLK